MEYAVGEARLERELDESEGGELVQPPAVAVGALCELERGGGFCRRGVCPNPTTSTGNLVFRKEFEQGIFEVWLQLHVEFRDSGLGVRIFDNQAPQPIAVWHNHITCLSQHLTNSCVR